MSLHQLITRPLAAKSQGSSSSCWAFLPSTCTLALFQADGKSGQLSQAPHHHRGREGCLFQRLLLRSEEKPSSLLGRTGPHSCCVSQGSVGQWRPFSAFWIEKLDTELGAHMTAGRAGNYPWWSGSLSLRDLSLKHHLSVWFLKSVPGSCWQSLTCSHA